MHFIIITLLSLTWLSTGLYVSGRFGFTFNPTDSNQDELVAGAILCPVLWPLFILYRFLHHVYVWGSNRKFED